METTAVQQSDEWPASPPTTWKQQPYSRVTSDRPHPLQHGNNSRTAEWRVTSLAPYNMETTAVQQSDEWPASPPTTWKQQPYSRVTSDQPHPLQHGNNSRTAEWRVTGLTPYNIETTAVQQSDEWPASPPTTWKQQPYSRVTSDRPHPLQHGNNSRTAEWRVTGLTPYNMETTAVQQSDEWPASPPTTWKQQPYSRVTSDRPHPLQHGNNINVDCLSLSSLTSPAFVWKHQSNEKQDGRPLQDFHCELLPCDSPIEKTTKGQRQRCAHDEREPEIERCLT